MTESSDKKTLPRRKGSKHTSALDGDEVNKNLGILRKPGVPLRLEKNDEDKQLHLLLVDDDELFLESITDVWKNNYQQVFTLHTFKPSLENDLFTKIEGAGEVPFDAIFLDRNMPGGTSGEEYLKRLKSSPATHYLPVIMVSAVYTGHVQPGVTAWAGQAEQTLVSKRPTAGFLHEMISVAEQSRDAILDRVWINLIDEITLHISEQKGEKELVIQSLEHLKKHLSVNDFYLRKKVGSRKLKCLHPEHMDKKLPEEIDPEKAPLLKRLLNEKSKRSYRYENLTSEDASQFSELVNYRVLAAPIPWGNEKIGTLTLYRSPQNAPFREKDEFFIRQLAATLGTYLGSQEEAAWLRESQSKLLKFVSEVFDKQDEQKVIDLLGEYLHQHLNANNAGTNTTIRLLDFSSGELVNYFQKGERNSKDTTITLYSKDRTYAQVVAKGEAILCLDFKSCHSGKFSSTTGMNSCITVPLKTAGFILGGANMEHPNIAFFKTEDKEFADALTDMAASALLRLRAQRFQQDLLKLISQVFNMTSQDILQQVFGILCRFTGCACLLHLGPEQEGEGWVVEGVYYIDEENEVRDIGEKKKALWNQHIKTHWKKNYLSRQLSLYQTSRETFFYTSDTSDIQGDELFIAGAKMITKSQAVLIPSSKTVLWLLFRLPDALNSYQKSILKVFVPFLEKLLESKQRVEQNYDRMFIAERQAEIGQAYSQIRHVLVNQMGGIGNVLEQLRGAGVQEGLLDEVDGILDKMQSRLDGARNLIRIPDFVEVDIGMVWQRAVKALGAQAQKYDITIVPFDKPVHWVTDPELLYVIIYNLIDNALQACQGLGRSCDISLAVQQEDEWLRLNVSDNGPGIPEEIQRKIFDIGMTTKSQGAGFGLYFSRLQAGSLGGKLSLDDASTEGSRFVISLPKQLPQKDLEGEGNG